MTARVRTKPPTVTAIIDADTLLQVVAAEPPGDALRAIPATVWLGVKDGQAVIEVYWKPTKNGGPLLASMLTSILVKGVAP